MTSYPRLTLAPTVKADAAAGRPWLFAGQLLPDGAWKGLAAGSLAHVADARGRLLGTYHVNPHSLIAARLLTRNPARAIDLGFWTERLAKAAALRARLGLADMHRLVHGEADGLPGLVIDRFGSVAVLQPNTAGMAAALDEISAALAKVLPDVTCHIVNADGPARHQEGLEADHRLLRGAAPSPCAVVENGVTYHIDPAGGQKTGWFFDHRRNRAFAAELAAGRSVLDLYSYAGGFGLLAAARGAASVLSVDRAQPALDLAASAAQAAGLNNWRSETAEVFAWLEGAAERFDLVIADPPAFAKAKKDIPTAVQGYKKLARLCAARVAPGGLLALASCSHHVDSAAFLDACASGIRAGGRGAALLHSAAAGPDHPVHPMLPQTGYLKFLLFGLD